MDTVAARVGTGFGAQSIIFSSISKLLGGIPRGGGRFTARYESGKAELKVREKLVLFFTDCYNAALTAVVRS